MTIKIKEKLTVCPPKQNGKFSFNSLKALQQFSKVWAGWMTTARGNAPTLVAVKRTVKLVPELSQLQVESIKIISLELCKLCKRCINYVVISTDHGSVLLIITVASI